MPDDRIEIRVSDDRLEAWARLLAGPPAAPEALEARLAAFGLVEGLDAAAIDGLAHALELEGESGEPRLIARGRAPEPGEPARLEIDPPAGPLPGAPREDGSLDYRERTLVLPVEPGDAIGRLHPARPGKPGRDVFGEPIPAPEPEPLTVRHGEGVEIDADGVLRATRVGARTIERDETIDVVECYVHPGPVDLASGGLDSRGSLAIGRDVASGFRVRAAHDVSVGGTVDGGRLRAGGSVEIRGGAIGHDEGRIEAAGDVRVRHVLSMPIVAGGTLHVQRSVSGGRLRARAIVVEGRMLGDEARAETTIAVRDAGSPAGGPCRLRAAAPLARRPASQSPSPSGRQRSREPVRGGVHEAGRDHGDGRARRRGRAEKGGKLRRKQALFALLDWRRQQRALQAEASIEVSGVAHAGTRIDFGGRPLVLESNVRTTRFRFDVERDEIVMEELS